MSSQPETKPWILITGASSGIGEEFVKRFAQEGWNIVLVARSTDKLRLLSLQIQKEYAVSSLVVTADLFTSQAPKEILAQIRSEGITLKGLINNAGVGAAGTFRDVALNRYLEMMDLNIRALVELTHLFLNDLIETKGILINVSSVASFQPLNYSSVYAASKAFVTSFSEALWLELKGTGVRVINLCPGLTKTNFGNVAGGKDYRLDPMAEPVEAVVDAGMRAIRGHWPTVISGWGNRFLVCAERFVPHWFLLWAIPYVQRIRKGI